jgi:multicomponent Na+:H+ antiporter subunit G
MVVDILSYVLLVAGGLLGVIGGIGIHRFPDFFTRLHAAGITDTLCAALILLGLGLQAGLDLASFKLLMIFAFLLFTSPTASHALANAAIHGGLKPLLETPVSTRKKKKATKKKNAAKKKTAKKKKAALKKKAVQKKKATKKKQIKKKART